MNAPKTIFITGAGSGIGRAMALHFAKQGWFVGLGDIDEQANFDTEDLIGGGFTYAHAFDVRDRAAWDRALAAFDAAAGGRLDVLANNAGVPLGGALVDLSEEEIDRVMAINFRAVVHGARAAHPYLKKTAGSCLLNTCSASALYGQAGMTIYGASKFAVRALTESLDAEWAPDGIRVRDIMPGFIDTALLAQPSHHGDNTPIRDRVQAAGLEFTPVEDVAQAAWTAVHGDKVHTMVGTTAKQMALAAKFAPGFLRKRARQLAESGLRPMG